MTTRATAHLTAIRALPDNARRVGLLCVAFDGETTNEERVELCAEALGLTPEEYVEGLMGVCDLEVTR